MTRSLLITALCFFSATLCAESGEGLLAFDFGADLRIRQEIMDNVPGLPGGGVAMPLSRSGYRNHMRFRPRVWGEATIGENSRIYLRLADEFRWNVRPRNRLTEFPDELIVDNLFFESKDMFGGLVDFSAGRQDIYALYGLDHIFGDGTPGDGSRTVYSDMVRLRIKFDEAGSLDVFALYNADKNPLRWGTHRSEYRSLTGFGGGAQPDMDDWGYGAIWSSEMCGNMDMQLFAMQKRTSAFWRGDEKHSAKRRSLAGVKLVPHLNDELSLQLEAMGQVGRDGRGEWLSGWSAYAGVNWKAAERVWASPFASSGLHFMSGDKNAASEDGGNGAWDPMWARAVNDSEMFLYGTHYGTAWWSNLMLAKVKGGLEFSKRHEVCASFAAMFAQSDDGLGGGDGPFKGVLSQLRYSFPVYSSGDAEGRSFEVFGHLIGELFNPGDYFATDRPGWFVRWQMEFKF